MSSQEPGAPKADDVAEDNGVEPKADAIEDVVEDAEAEEEAEAEAEEEAEEDAEEDAEEEEDAEDEDEVRGRKRRRLQFLDVEAEDDDEEDDLSGEEDGLQGEDGFVQEKADDEGDQSAYRQADRRQRQKEQFTDLDAEVLAKQYRDRYGRSAANKYSTGGTVPRQLLLPSVDDAPIFGLNCRHGREKEAVRAVLRRQLSLAQGSAVQQQQGIFSAFQRDGFPGRIYIEAATEAATLRAVAGIPNVFSNSKVLKVPIREYPDMFHVVQKQEAELVPGKYVRIKRGLYKGDLAIVVDLSENGLEARLKLVPRLDYGRTTSVDGGAEKRKRADRPAQRLFSADEAGNHDPRALVPHGANAWTYGAEDYVKGFLHKDFKLATLEVDDVRPTLAEIAKLQEGGDDGELDLASLGDELRRSATQATAFTAGERVEVVQGEQTGLTGRVAGVSGHDSIVTVVGDRAPYRGLEVSVPAAQLRKHFAVGDHARVVRGNYKDDTGLVVATNAGQVTLLSDASRSEVTVFARDLRAASDTTVQNQLAGFAIQDLVQVNAQTVGCVVDVERDTVRVLTQDAQVVTLKPEAIALKLRAGGQRAATDARGHEVTVGDTVREVAGEHRTGTILHVHHQFVFLHNRERAENLGVFVNRVSQIAMVSTKAGGRERLDLSQMNPAAQAQPTVASAPRAANFNPRRIVGQKISIGPGSGFKGLKGVVRDATDTVARIELEARNKVVSVSIQKLLFTSPVTKQLVPLREFMYGARSEGPAAGGRPHSAGTSAGLAIPRTGGWNTRGSATPAWNSGGGVTPAWNSGGQTPAWNARGGRTPAWNDSGRTPAWNAESGRTPAWNADSGRTPAWSANSGRTPAWSAEGGRTPAWSAAGGRTPVRDWDSGSEFFSASAPTPGAPTPAPLDDEVKYDDE